MKVDPDTTVANLLTAIPSSALVLKRFGMASGDANKTLQQACADRGIEFEQFIRAMNAIDWNKEAPAARKSGQS